VNYLDIDQYATLSNAKKRTGVKPSEGDGMVNISGIATR
jgi:hypothetical protein